jgi:hypothetical protein
MSCSTFEGINIVLLKATIVASFRHDRTDQELTTDLLSNLFVFGPWLMQTSPFELSIAALVTITLR